MTVMIKGWKSLACRLATRDKVAICLSPVSPLSPVFQAHSTVYIFVATATVCFYAHYSGTSTILIHYSKQKLSYVEASVQSLW